MMWGQIRLGVAAVLLVATVATTKSQQPRFYAGKTVRVYLAGAPGGAYDAYGRLVARNLGRHLPGNPDVVASNMQGGAGFISANFTYNIAPRDGTAILVPVENLAEQQVLGTSAVNYDASRFGWIGRIAPNIEVSYVWSASGIRQFDDLTKRETIFAGQGPSADLYPMLLNTFAGTRIKVVRGYQGVPSIHQAMENGEVEGMTGSLDEISTTVPEWFRDGRITVVVQYQETRHPQLPNVPTALEVIPNEQDRKLFSFFLKSGSIGRAVLAPPGLPQERLAELRSGFADMMKDPEFINQAQNEKLSIGSLSGELLQSIVESQVNVDSVVRERILALDIH
jgi:tripartite-type tricarboxylate transporter receptor subunit TctC